MALPSLLTNKVKIAITPTLQVSHKSKGGVWQEVVRHRMSRSLDVSHAVDLQYKKHILVIRFIQF
jgi:hypothetical protein